VALSNIVDAIAGILETVDGVGRVHKYQRFAAKWNDVLDKFRDADGRYNAWMISRPKMLRRSQTLGELEILHAIRIEGIYSHNDSGASETAFQGVVDAIADTFLSYDDLNGACLTTEPDWGPLEGHRGIQLENAEIRMFGGTLCHYCDLRLSVLERRIG